MQQEEFDRLHGFYLEDLKVGMHAEVSKVFHDADVDAYAGISGDVNPLHLDDEFAALTRAGGRVVHGMVTASLISTLVGCKLPGPGCLWMGQTIKFMQPVNTGDRVRATATVTELMLQKQRVRMHTQCRVGDTVVVDGEALVWVPSRSAA